MGSWEIWNKCIKKIDSLGNKDEDISNKVCWNIIIWLKKEVNGMNKRKSKKYEKHKKWNNIKPQWYNNLSCDIFQIEWIKHSKYTNNFQWNCFSWCLKIAVHPMLKFCCWC